VYRRRRPSAPASAPSSFAWIPTSCVPTTCRRLKTRNWVAHPGPPLEGTAPAPKRRDRSSPLHAVSHAQLCASGAIRCGYPPRPGEGRGRSVLLRTLPTCPPRPCAPPLDRGQWGRTPRSATLGQIPTSREFCTVVAATGRQWAPLARSKPGRSWEPAAASAVLRGEPCHGWLSPRATGDALHRRAENHVHLTGHPCAAKASRSRRLAASIS
jgi:hypothetical protein